MTEEKFQKKLKKIQLKNKEIELKNKLKEERNKYSYFNFFKMKTSNKILAVSIIAILLFTIACLYIQYATSIEVSSTLITFWYSFWTVEIVSLAGIRVSKVFKDCRSKDEQSDVEIDDSNVVG